MRFGIDRSVVRLGLRLAPALGLAVVLLSSGGCIPALVDFTEAQVIELADQQAPVLTQEYGGEVASAVVRDYVNARGQELAAVSMRPRLDWRFKVLDNEAVNAFALPGGHVFITRGLLARLQNEAELVAVLGHEVGHVTLNHGEKRMEKAATATMGAELVGALLEAMTNEQSVGGFGKYATQMGLQMAQLRHSRDDESEADERGVQLTAKLGYNPAGLIGVLEVLSQISKGDSIEMLQTHPNPQKRIKDVLLILQKQYPDWQAIDGKYHRYEFENYEEQVLNQLAAMPPAPDVALVIPDGVIGLMAPAPGYEGGCVCGH